MKMTKLYKFISNDVDALKSIVSGNIKFTTIDELNDPTDLFPRFNITAIEKSLKKMRTEGHSEKDLILLRKQEELFNQIAENHNIIGAPESIQEANLMIHSSVYDNTLYLKNAFEKTTKTMRKECGIFCLTESNTSLPMWAHYATNANGFVIEFTGLEELFNSETTGVLDLLLPVKYKPTIEGATFEPSSYKSVFTEKNIDWQYEKEWRVVTNLNNCIVVTSSSNCKESGPIHLMKIDKKFITKVIFGWNIDKENIKILSEVLKGENSAIQCVSTKIINGEVRVV